MSITLAILAGGAGRRMGGRPKGLLRVGGKTILERLLPLAARCDDVFLVADDDGPYRRFGLRAVPDVVKGKGAPGALVSALGASRTEWVAAVACDMPFVTEPVLSALVESAGPDVGALCFEVAGRLEPLPSLWRTSVYHSLLSKLEGGPSLLELFAAAKGRSLLEEALRRVDPSGLAVRSVNTPEDARALGVDENDGRQ